MKISVLVPTLGSREEELNRLIDTLEKQTYKNFEVIFVTQGNHDKIANMIKSHKHLTIKQLKMNTKGLSKARNVGLKAVTGDIVILSDDDCWYPFDAFEHITDIFDAQKNAKIVLTQIFDPNKNVLYKSYDSNSQYINNKLKLMAKSSIEIAFKKDLVLNSRFDELFGLGSKFICGEEIDFLLSNYEKKTIYYSPTITVFHDRKDGSSNQNQIIAKGAIYGKNFNVLICLLVLFRDLFIKHENNFKYFWEGYNEYFKGKN